MNTPGSINTDAERSLLDQLLTDSRLYTQSKDYKELLDFVVRLRNFAPFNAMLLQVQNPGLSYAASAHDWQARFGRSIKEGARPLLILWPFGPVALVYDVQDTEGKPLPKDVAAFFARGAIDDQRLAGFKPPLCKKGIDWLYVDAGDQRAGMIRVVQRPAKPNEKTLYRIHINRNHPAPTQFTTLAHELAHLFLGHMGPDKPLNVPERPTITHTQRELEAESVAFLVCKRNGVTSKSETYLANFVQQNTTVEHLDLYQVMRAAGQVESTLGLTAHTKYEKPAQLSPQQTLFDKSLTGALGVQTTTELP
ncbi:MAG TPA: ImmA/IrrE family metallo-endopeptidase [Clostridia bacterium]|nr:ImmA/IrrE family metallo-endopeptidase [Clostridia bacterium]